jgi:hypothetical protein
MSEFSILLHIPDVDECSHTTTYYYILLYILDLGRWGRFERYCISICDYICMCVLSY